MKKIIFGLLWISSNLYSAFSGQFEPLSSGLSTDRITQLLETPRITNLVVFNDVNERIVDYGMPWDEEDRLRRNAAVTLALRDTLVDNECLVLCSKANLIALQLLVSLWDAFCTDPENVVVQHLMQNLSSEARQNLLTVPVRMLNLETRIALYQQKIQKVTKIYDEINTLSEIGDESEITDGLQILSQELFTRSLDLTSNVLVQNLFCCYAYFDIICENDYVCKQVNDEFVLFIPKHLVNQYTTVMMQDVQLGLNFSMLSNYDYKEIPDKDRIQEVVARASHIDAANNLGEKLLEALKILILSKDQLVKKVSALNNDRYKAEAVLPFFNIFLDGHGDLDQRIAGISIKKTSSSYFSNFEQLLRFLNSEIKTKSLTVLSCFPGGKKLLDTFHVKTPFDSSILDQITYPIINIGTQTSSVFLSALHKAMVVDIDTPVFFTQRMLYAPWKPSITVFSDYFSLLNETLPNYEKAFKLISGFYPEDGAFSLNNYIGVKFPHLSWFSAYEFQKHSKQISQIEALTTKEILFSADPDVTDRLKVILLGANVIPGEIRFENFTSDTLPTFLPINYFNQNYVIHSMNIINTDKNDVAMDMFYLLLKFLPIFNVSEPINIVIKNLMFNHIEYFDVYFFTKLEYAQGHKISGFMFTDVNGQVWISAWPVGISSGQPIQPMPLSPFNTASALAFITPVELQARDGLKQFPGLEKDSFKKLEQVMQNKAKGLVPEKVQKSYEIKTKHEMLSRVIDTVHRLNTSVV